MPHSEVYDTTCRRLVGGAMLAIALGVAYSCGYRSGEAIGRLAGSFEAFRSWNEHVRNLFEAKRRG